MKVNDINVSKLMYVPILFNNATHNEWQDMYKIHKNKISPYKLLNKNSCKKIYTFKFNYNCNVLKFSSVV